MRTNRNKLSASVPLLITLAMLWVAGPVGAEEAPAPATSAAPAPDASVHVVDEHQMQADMHRYFKGEKQGGIWLMAVGAPAVAAGTGLLFHESEFSRGLAYPLLAFGAIEVLGGLVFYLNSNRRVPRFDKQIGQSPAAYRDSELTRIRGVNRDMRALEAIEIALMMAGGTMTGIGVLRSEDILSGVGTGLLVEGAVLFVYDQLAARRALRYFDSLTHFSVGPASSPAVGSGPMARGALLTMVRPF